MRNSPFTIHPSDISVSSTISVVNVVSVSVCSFSISLEYSVCFCLMLCCIKLYHLLFIEHKMMVVKRMMVQMTTGAVIVRRYSLGWLILVPMLSRGLMMLNSAI